LQPVAARAELGKQHPQMPSEGMVDLEEAQEKVAGLLQQVQLPLEKGITAEHLATVRVAPAAEELEPPVVMEQPLGLLIMEEVAETVQPLILIGAQPRHQDKMFLARSILQVEAEEATTTCAAKAAVMATAMVRQILEAEDVQEETALRLKQPIQES
jgi:hypothetical protein